MTNRQRNYVSFTFMWPCIVTNFFLIKPKRPTNFINFILSKRSTCFGHFLCHLQEFSTVHLTLVYFFASLMTASKQGHEGNLTLLGSCHQTCKKYTSVECTVENSWRWAKEMPETCRAFWQKKVWEICGSFWFYLKEKYVSFNMWK